MVNLFPLDDSSVYIHIQHLIVFLIATPLLYTPNRPKRQAGTHQFEQRPQLFVLPNTCVMHTHHQVPREESLSLLHSPDQVLAAVVMQILTTNSCFQMELKVAHAQSK